MTKIIICGLLLLMLVPVRSISQTRPLEDSPEARPSYDLSRLDLTPAQRTELQTALEAKDFPRAETILVDQINQDAQSLRAAGLLEFAGGIFFLDAQYSNAIIAWKKAEAIAPLDERSKFTLAMADIKANRRDWAWIELERLSASHAGNPLYLYWLARLDYDAQRYNDAIVKLGNVISLDPKMARAYDLLGLCFDYIGKLDDAIKNLDRAAALNRTQPSPSPWPSLDLATVQIEMNRLTEAEAILREAIHFDSRLPQAHYQLGRVLEKEGKLPEATETLKTAAALDPAYPDPHFLLGRIYHRTGQAKLGDSEIQQFQQLQKQASDATAAKPMATR